MNSILKVDKEYTIPDYYIFVTDLAKKHNRQVCHWLDGMNIKKILCKLYLEINTPLVLIRMTGKNKNRGTWLHPNAYEYFLKWLNIRNDRHNYEVSRYEQDFELLLNTSFKNIVTFVRQKKIDSCFLDFYSEEYNLVIEYDEKHHKSKTNKLKDNNREQYLKDKYNFNFIRVEQGKEIEGLNKIIKFIIGNK